MIKVVILLKDAITGQVMTRLGKDIGMDNARKVHEILAINAVDVALSTKLPVELSFSGDLDSPFAQKLGELPVSIYEQIEGTLGAKIHQALRRADRVIAIGIDCPGIIPANLLEAAKKTEIIFAPAADGGYCLVAASSPPIGLFQDIEWSTASVLETSLQHCKNLGLKYSLLPMSYDIDTQADLIRLLKDPSLPSSLQKRLIPYARSTITTKKP